MKNKKIINIIKYIIFSIFIMIIFNFKYKNSTNSFSDLKIQGVILIISLIIGGIILLKKNINKKIKIIFVLIAITLYVSYPLYNDYLVWAHDLAFHQMRIGNLSEALRNLQIPTRIYQLRYNGYGYGAPMLYPDLFLYIPAILRVINASAEFSYKILLIFINFMSVLSMYLCVKNISKSSTSGIIGAVLYASANYRLEDVYARSAIGEALALAFFPILIWGLYEVCTGDRKKWYLLVIGMTCIIQSHIISLFLALIVCLIFAIYYINKIIKEKRYKVILLSIIATLLLNLWFIIPFIQNYSVDLVVKQMDYDQFFWDSSIIPAQLFNFFDTGNSKYISNGLSSGMQNEMNFSLGFLYCIGILVSILYCIKKREKNNNTTKFLKLVTYVSIAFLILATSIMPWKEIIQKFEIIKKLCDRIQFTWRFLIIPTIGIAITTSIIIGEYIISKYKEKNNWLQNNKIVIICFVIAFITIPMFLGDYSKSGKYIEKGGETYFDDFNSEWNYYGEYLINGTNTSKCSNTECIPSDYLIVVDNIEKEGTKTIINYQNYAGKGFIELPLFYYPVYTAKDENGNKVDLVCGENNCIRVVLDEIKSGKIIVDCKDNGLYLFADYVSLISLILFISFFIIKNKKIKATTNKIIKEENIEGNVVNEE